MKPVIFLDMDGVLKNFVKASIKLCNLPMTHSQCTKWNYFEEYMTVKMFDHMINSEDGFWLGIEPYPWAHDLVNECRRRAEVVFFSSPGPYAKSASEKLQWLLKHGFLSESFTGSEYLLGRSKYLVAGPGRILIDDHAEQLTAFRAAGGTAIRFPQPWNTSDEVELENPLWCVVNNLKNIFGR